MAPRPRKEGLRDKFCKELVEKRVVVYLDNGTALKGVLTEFDKDDLLILKKGRKKPSCVSRDKISTICLDEEEPNA